MGKNSRRLHSDIRRSKQINVSLRPHEWKRISRKAQAARQNRAEWVRLTVFAAIGESDPTRIGHSEDESVKAD